MFKKFLASLLLAFLITIPSHIDATSYGSSPVTLTGTQSLSNKTLASPVITGTAGDAPTVDVLYESSLIRAWLRWSESAGTPSVADDFNFTTSVTDNGTGDYTFTIDTDMTSGTYAAICTTFGTTSNNYHCDTISGAAGTIQIAINHSDGTSTDAAGSMIIFGAQ